MSVAAATSAKRTPRTGEVAVGADLRDERQADEHERDRDPQPRLDLFAEEHPRDDGDGEHGQVLEQQRDADREQADRDGVASTAAGRRPPPRGPP